VGFLISVHLKGPSSPIRLVADKVEHDLRSLRFLRNGFEIEFAAREVDRWEIEEASSNIAARPLAERKSTSTTSIPPITSAPAGIR
jgi:hypothetical protein